MTADFSNLSPVSSDPAQFHGLIGVTLEGDPRLLDPSVLGGGGGGSGTVTSVGLSVPTGLAVTGSPITTSGTIALNFAPGYGIPTTVRQSEWDAAYNDKINTATFNTTNGILTLTQQDGGTITINLDGRYLTSFTESDPVFSASPAAGITAPQISNWDTAFGWGNHAVAGYLLSSTAATTYQPLDGDLTAIGALAGTTGLLRKTAADTWSLDTATYLQSSEIGSTILAYDANLQSFVNTFTLPTTDGTSGQVLTTNGAGVISFTTVSGGSSGFDYIQSTPTPPATTAGQLWFKPTDGDHPGTSGIWLSTGAYWVSPDVHSVSLGMDHANTGFTGTTNSAVAIGALPTRFGNFLPLIYVESVQGSARVLTTADASNYWWFSLFTCQLSNVNGAASGTAVFNVNGITGNPSGGDATFRATTAGVEVDISKSIKAPLNLGVSVTVHTYALQFYAYKQGTPGNLDYAHLTTNFRRLHP